MQISRTLDYYRFELNRDYQKLNGRDKLIALFLAYKWNFKAENAIFMAHEFGSNILILDSDQVDYAEFEDAFLHDCVDYVNYCYEMLGFCIDIKDDAAADDFGNLYERGIAKYAEMFGYPESQFEDLCTDTRHYGWDRC